MASNYVTQTQQQTVQVLGPTQAVDVMTVGALTVPHGVYFERVVPLTVWGTSAADPYIGELATAIEQRLSSGLAVSAVFRTDVDTSGLLTDYVDFTVEVAPAANQSGPMQAVVSVPVNLLTADQAFVGDLVTPMFEDAVAKLNATAAL
jgi:hypothetical protein